MRRYVAGFVVLPLLLLSAACGGDSDDSTSNDEESTTEGREATISDVTVTGEVGEKPKVEFKAPLSFTKTESEIIEKGDGTGPKASKDSIVTIDYVGINASTGEEFDTSYGKTPATFPLGQVIPGLRTGLEGAQAGDRVLVTIASKDGFDPTGSQDGTVKKGDSLVFVADVTSVVDPLDEAQGKATPAPASVPTLVLDKDGHPSKFKKTPTTPAKVDKLGVYTVIKGTGPEVKAGQQITVQYVGQIYPDGKVFDESWSTGQPATFQIGTGAVIKGWDQGLVGQTVGSRVILVIPAALGYGKQGQGEDIPPNSDLIFAIDILSAS